MQSALISMALRVLGLGAVLAAVSEIWFYPVALDSHVLWLCLFYGPLAYTTWLVIARLRVRTWAGAFWGACLFGFFIEGIPVPVLYEALPFTILWTSIAWHALISAALGLWAFRVMAARKSLFIQVMFFALAGAYLGAWSVELWSLQDVGWIWNPTQAVATQFFAGWAMFVGGHIALDMAARKTAVPLRWEVWVFATFTALLALAQMIAVFPLSLVLPVLCALALYLMWRDGQGAQTDASPVLVRLSSVQVPMLGYAASILIPLAATLTYHALRTADLQLESSAFHILWAGPVSLVLLVYSAIRILRRRPDHSQ